MPKRSSRENLVERLSARAATKTAKITYEGAVPFGREEVHRYRLGNGLRLRVLVDRSAPVVSYHTWFSVGSRHERHGKTGLAHFFEHMMFTETKTLEKGAFDRKLEEAGAESNAATWVDWTYYYENLPKDRLGLAITLEADRMRNLVLRDPEIASERDVVANERRFRVEDDVEGAASELLYKTAFTLHPYRWPVLGWMEDIQRFERRDCEEFYRTFYAPNNALLVIVGDLDEASLLMKVQRAYGSLRPSKLRPSEPVVEPPQTAPREAVLRKPTATEKLLCAFPGPALADADHPALTLVSEVLFGGRASRLHRLLVTERECANDPRGWVSTFRDPGVYEVGATARQGHTLAEIEPTLFAELERVRTELVTDDELARAKARLELGLLQSLETAGGKAEQIGFYESVLGDPSLTFKRLEAYRAATAEQLRAAAQRFLDPARRNIVRVYPDTPAASAKEVTS